MIDQKNHFVLTYIYGSLVLRLYNLKSLIVISVFGRHDCKWCLHASHTVQLLDTETQPVEFIGPQINVQLEELFTVEITL